MRTKFRISHFAEVGNLFSKEWPTVLSIEKREIAVATRPGNRGKDKIVNTRPLEMIPEIHDPETETDALVQSGFSEDEIISLLWLRQWYQHGGSDRAEVLRHFEFLKILIVNGKIEH